MVRDQVKHQARHQQPKLKNKVLLFLSSSQNVLNIRNLIEVVMSEKDFFKKSLFNTRYNKRCLISSKADVNLNDFPKKTKVKFADSNVKELPKKRKYWDSFKVLTLNNALRFYLVFLSFFIVSINSAWALDESSLYQFHLRMGMFNGSYAGSGVEARGWSVPTTIDAELEVFLTRDKSFNLTATMAMELDTNKVNYTYAGVGQTYYLFSRGRKDVRSEKLVQIKTLPKTRYYWGWNAGIAQVLAIDYGLILGTYSTTLDVSGNVGMIYQIGENMGVEFRGGMGMGYGFSTVTVTGTTMRALVGITYFLR